MLASVLLTAVRRLRRRPGQSLAAVLLLAVGIGAAAAVFTVVESTLLRPLPFGDAERLALIWGKSSSDERLPVPAPFVPELEAVSRTLARVSYVLRTEEAALETDAGALGVRVNVVAPDLFDLLGVSPAAGRLMRVDESLVADGDGASPGPVLLDHAFWRRVLGADPNVVGRTLRLDGSPSYVVGVLPAGFRLPLPPVSGIASSADIWRPIRVPLSAFRRDAGLRDQDSDNRGLVVALVAKDVTVARARAEVAELGSRLWQDEGASAQEGRALWLVPFRDDATATARPLLALLSAAVILVLILIAGNVAGLLLAGTADRQPELAVRAALGGNRGQVLGPVVAEGLILGLCAGVLGLVAGASGTRLLVAAWPAALPPPADIEPGWRVLLFGTVLALAMGVATALPALTGSRVSGLPALRGPGALAASGGAVRVRRMLVTAELALSVILMIGAGLLVQTFGNLRQIDTGFDPEGVVTFDLSLVSRDRYRGPADRAGFVRALEERLGAIPGVGAVGVVGGAPLSGEHFIQPWGWPGEGPDAWSGAANYRVITERYFEALGVRVTEGRAFRREDDRQDQRVAIVDEALAGILGGRRGGVGGRIGIPVDGDAVEAEIVGVVPTIRYDDLQSPGRPTVYVPYRHEASRRITVAVRSDRQPSELFGQVNAAVAELDPALPLFRYRGMRDYVLDATAAPRFALRLLTGFAALAAVIALTGLHALVAYSVSRRVPEIGLRMALGADSRRVGRLVLAEGLRIMAPAFLLGAFGATVLGRLMAALLFGVSPVEPLTLAVVGLLTLATVIAAVAAPAYRAAGLDPAEALRSAA